MNISEKIVYYISIADLSLTKALWLSIEQLDAFSEIFSIDVKKNRDGIWFITIEGDPK